MDSSPAAARLHEIDSGVWAWVQPDGSWWLNNAGAVAGDDGLLIVDTCATDRRTRRFLAAVAEAAPGAPVRWAVNTHQHGDHTYGNSLLPPETVVFGHTRMRDGLLVDPIIDGCPPLWSPVPDWGEVTRRVPAVTFESNLTVHNGRRRIELRHPGFAAHTPGDAVAWLPEERVLFSGDLLFHGLTPLVFMGSLPGAIRSLDWISAFRPAQVVPGHGPLIDAAHLDEVLAVHERYYRFVLDLADRGRRDGRAPLAVAQGADLGEFAGWADAERLVANLHRAYADAAGEEVDVAAALADSVTWLGGPMHTSV